jgi:hypothetical protein
LLRFACNDELVAQGPRGASARRLFNTSTNPAIVEPSIKTLGDDMDDEKSVLAQMTDAMSNAAGATKEAAKTAVKKVKRAARKVARKVRQKKAKKAKKASKKSSAKKSAKKTGKKAAKKKKKAILRQSVPSELIGVALAEYAFPARKSLG